MTASASEEMPQARSLATGASPGTIRAALLAEDRELFDRAYAAALDEARRSYELTPVLETVEEWRRRAAEFFAGEAVPEDEPFAVTRAKAGL